MKCVRIKICEFKKQFLRLDGWLRFRMGCFLPPIGKVCICFEYWDELDIKKVFEEIYKWKSNFNFRLKTVLGLTPSI